MSSFCVRLSFIVPEHYDILVGELFELGASGLSENVPFSISPDDFQAKSETPEFFEVCAYFSHPPALEKLRGLEARFSGMRWSLEEVPERDWLAEWKKGFHSFHLVKDLFVVPSWEEFREGPERRGIFIDPGMAFGTGTHATTSLLSEMVSRYPSTGPVLDVGTGTGLLAIVALKLGAPRAVVTEIDPDALRVAQENFLKNGLSNQVEVRRPDLSKGSDSYELVMANIVDGVLLKMKNELVEKSGGVLLLSGILTERWENFLKVWMDGSTELIEFQTRDEWTAAAFRRVR